MYQNINDGVEGGELKTGGRAQGGGSGERGHKSNKVEGGGQSWGDINRNVSILFQFSIIGCYVQ